MLKAVPDQKESLLAGYQFKPKISHTKNLAHCSPLSLSLSLIILFTNVQNKNIYTYVKVQ